MDAECLSSVSKENGRGYYRIHTIWRNDGFKVNIASESGSWTGEMTPENVATVSAQLRSTPDDYIKECKDALTTIDGKPGFSYAVEDNRFTWRKVIDEDTGDKINMGSIAVEPTQLVPTVQTMMDLALQQNKALGGEVNTLKAEQKLSKGYNNALEMKLNDLIQSKTSMEEDLYSKFLLVLNSKKERIAELEEALTKSNKEAAGTGKPTAKIKPNRKQTAVRKGKNNGAEHNEYEVDTDNDPDTDEEREVVKQARVAGKGKSLVSGSARTRNQVKKSKPATESTSVQSIPGEMESERVKESMCVAADRVGTATICQETEASSAGNCGPASVIHNFDNDKHLPSTQRDLLNFFFGDEDSPGLVNT